MSFLQPWMLFGLPIVLLPILIHLINQRRFQTIAWGAMMFLLAAHRMNRGYSRLRQWLIMLMRVLAIAGLLFAVSRPLAGGWLGLAGGDRADSTFILLDRSPSMQQLGEVSASSKLDTAREQLTRIFQTVGSDRWRLVDSATNKIFPLDAPNAIAELPSAGPAAASADLPQMLQAALDDIRDNRAGRTEIWIASDLRANDWAPDSGRWSALRNAFLEFPQGIRFHLLAYPRPADANIAVRVTDVKRRESSTTAEILVSIRLDRHSESADNVTVPVQIELEGARSVLPVELSGARVEIRDHPISIERSREQGWGRVSIPSDSNPADDDFYFVFDNPPVRRTVIVSDEPRVIRPLMLAAQIPPNPAIPCTAERIATDQLTGVEWDQVALVLWQAPIPTGTPADLIKSFVERGGQVVFFPPPAPNDNEIFGVRWGTWQNHQDPLPIETWRGDEDLLARTQSGQALPVGEIDIYRNCTIEGDLTPLASLRGGQTLLARVPSKTGGVYFWTTTPATSDSSLSTNGVVLYAFVQRALAAGASVLAKARQLDAADPATLDFANWERLAGPEDVLSTEYPFQPGVYRSSDQLLAINRSLAEDQARPLPDARIDGLFQGLQYDRLDDQAGNRNNLIQEIWRAFLIAMLIAIVLEAVLCLPNLARRPAATT